MERYLLDIALAEYNSLNNQILTKTKILFQIYLIYFAVLGVFYGFIFDKGKYDLLIFVPWMSLALFFRVYYDQQIMDLMSRYAKEELIPKQLLPLVTVDKKEEAHENPAIMQWGSFYKIHQPFPFYKISFFLIFVFLSVLPALCYNLGNKPWQNLKIRQLTWIPPFPPINHFIFSILDIIIALTITILIWKIDPDLRKRSRK